MRKTALLLALILASAGLYSCDDEKMELYRSFDTDKAEAIALDYMNGKYDETFSVVRSQKYKENGYAPGSIQSFWCDVEVSVQSPAQGNNYTVRVMCGDNGDYFIAGDNYMTALVRPLAGRDIESIVSGSSLDEYCTDQYHISEIGTGSSGTLDFTPDFEIDPENDTLSSMIGRYKIWLSFQIYLPESAYSNKLEAEFENILSSAFPLRDQDDYIRADILSFDDDHYYELKNIIESGGDLPENFEWKAVHNKSIKFD